MASVQVNVTTPVETYLWLEKAAEEVDLTVPGFIRFIVEDFRKSLQPKHPLHKYATQEEMQAILDGMDKSATETGTDEE